MKHFVFLLGMALLTSPLRAQECTSQWDLLLDTDPSHPKVIAGDTNAAYALFNFHGDPTKRLVFKGAFPHARFMSFETDYTRWGLKIAALFDYQIEPDADGNFTLEVAPEGTPAKEKNFLGVKSGQEQQSVLFRVYAPDRPVTPAEIPRVFAYDIATGEPVSCPVHAPTTMTLNLPQALTVFIRRKTRFDFQDLKVPWGPNSAIPAYLAAAVRTRPDDVVVIKFRAPTFEQPGGDVRYWSMCSLNIVKLITLDCSPDFLTPVSSDGTATIVFGAGADLKKAANDRGFGFLEDTRDSSQPVAELAYRHLLPTSAFETAFQASPEYRPHGVLCTREDFLSGTCGDE